MREVDDLDVALPRCTSGALWLAVAFCASRHRAAQRQRVRTLRTHSEQSLPTAKGRIAGRRWRHMGDAVSVSSAFSTQRGFPLLPSHTS